MDILQEHLVRARAAGGVFARSIAVAPWGLRLPGTIQLAVHAVIQGHAWLWLDGEGDPVELRPGDLALVRGGPDHFIATNQGRIASCRRISGLRTPLTRPNAIRERRDSFAGLIALPGTSV